MSKATTLTTPPPKAKPISRATGKPMSVKEHEFARLASPTGLFADEEAEDCRIPWIGAVSRQVLIDGGLKSYDAVKAKWLECDGDEAMFEKFLIEKGIKPNLAKKVAACYHQKSEFTS